MRDLLNTYVPSGDLGSFSDRLHEIKNHSFYILDQDKMSMNAEQNSLSISRPTSEIAGAKILAQACREVQANQAWISRPSRRYFSYMQPETSHSEHLRCRPMISGKDLCLETFYSFSQKRLYVDIFYGKRPAPARSFGQTWSLRF